MDPYRLISHRRVRGLKSPKSDIDMKKRGNSHVSRRGHEAVTRKEATKSHCHIVLTAASHAEATRQVKGTVHCYIVAKMCGKARS